MLPARASAADVDSMSRRELLSLAERSDQSRVSLYLSARDGRPRPKRLLEWKALIRAAARQLRATGMPAADVDRTLQPAGRAFDRDGRDPAREGSWVYFADTQWRSAMRVPISVPRLAVAGDRCYIAPLVPLLARSGKYVLLELSRDDIRLYAGTRVHLVRVPLEGLALGPLASLPPRAPPARAFAADRSGSEPRGFAHGMDGGTELDERRSILEHFRRVDTGICEMFGADEPPLVLGGAAHLRSLYREVNSYSRLLDGDVASGPRDIPPSRLHARSWPIVERVLHESQRQALSRFKLLQGTGYTLTEPHAVAIAAEAGRVETLIIASDATTSAQDSDNVVRLSGTPLYVERAVAGTLRSGGDVHLERKGRMPGGTTVAAILMQ
jgi:release factor family 3